MGDTGNFGINPRLILALLSIPILITRVPTWYRYSPWYWYSHPFLYCSDSDTHLGINMAIRPSTLRHCSKKKKITAWLTCCLNLSWAGVNLLMPNCITQEVVRVVSCSMCIMYIMCEYWASARLPMHKQTWPLLDPAVHSSFIAHTEMHVNINFKCHFFLGVGDPGNQSIGLIPKYQVNIGLVAAITSKYRAGNTDTK